MITFQHSNSSVSLDYIVVECKTCGTMHISFERNRHRIFILPETITTSKNKEKEYFLHCVEDCQAPPG